MPLDTELGGWLDTERHVRYPAYRTQQRLYLSDEDGPETIVTCFEEKSNLANAFCKTETVESIPIHAHPTKAYVKNTMAYPLQDYHFVPTDHSQDEMKNDIESLLPEDLHTATSVTAVSDGSLDPTTGRAAFAWILATDKRKSWIRRKRATFANPKYANSYRAELAGFCDMLKYCVEKKMFDTDFSLWCDNEAVVNVLQPGRECTLTDMTESESDLVKAARRYLRQLRKVTVSHVYGHQEDHVTYNDLPFEAQLNIDCDEEAKECMWASDFSNERPEPTEGTGAMLFFGNAMVTTEINEQIQWAAHAPAMFTYLRGRYEWTDNQLGSVNWRAMRLAKKRLKRHQSIRTSKMLHEWLNLGHQKMKMGQDELCPCCGLDEEDQVHLYRCKSKRMRESLETGIDAMEGNFHKANIPVAVYIAFIDTIRLVTRSTRERKAYSCPEAEAASSAQESLGSFAILRGHHHDQWAQAIMKTYKKRVSPPNTDKDKKKPRDKSPLEMSAFLIEECWRLFENIWATRNSVLHSSDGYAAQAEESALTRKLIRYKMTQNESFHYADRHHIDYPTDTIRMWNRKRKKQLIRTLNKLHKIYLLDIQLAAEHQTKLDDYFIYPD